MATNPGTLKLEVNIPQVIALQFSEGKEVESQFTGSQVMYSLTDGRKFYCAPFVAEKIRAAGVAAKMPFQICKRQHGKSIEFEIETHNQTKAAGATTPTASTSKAVQTTVPVLNPSTNMFEMPARPMPQQPEPAPLSSMATRMLSAYVVAFDVIARLQEVSEQRGLGLNWLQEEHIRALATSAFIEENTERREAARRRS